MNDFLQPKAKEHGYGLNGLGGVLGHCVDESVHACAAEELVGTQEGGAFVPVREGVVHDDAVGQLSRELVRGGVRVVVRRPGRALDSGLEVIAVDDDGCGACGDAVQLCDDAGGDALYRGCHDCW